MGEIRKLYFASFFLGLSTVASVTFTLFFLLNGLNFSQISILFSIFMISLALLEIPTGAFADTFGHKASVFLGMLIHAFSFLILSLGSSFSHFAIAMFLAALGLAFQSGAISSLIYELLGKIEKKEAFEKIHGKISALFIVATIISGPIGALIYKFYPRIPYLMAFVFIFVGAIFVFIVKWEFKKEKISLSVYTEKIRSGIKLTFSNAALISFILIAISMTTIRMVFNQNINQPYQLEIGLDVAYIGITAAIVAGFSALVANYSYKISKKVGNLNSLLLMVFIPSLSAIILSQINNLLGLVFITIFYLGHAYRDPALARLTQNEISSDYRSTVASTGSFVSSLIVGLTLPFYGNLMDQRGLNYTLIVLGAFSIAIGLIAVSIYKIRR